MTRAYQLPHVLTYWKKTDNVDLYGKTEYIVGKMACRYMSNQKLYVNEFGQNMRSMAYIYTNSDFLKNGDVVINGDYESNLTPVPGAFEIKTERHSSNQRGDREEHRYIL